MNVLEFIDRQEKSQELLYFLRDIIIGMGPFVEEKIKYRTPFYHIGTSWLYLTIAKDDSVNVCFVKGCHFELFYPSLIHGNRKYIRSLNFKDIASVDVVFLNEILMHSVEYQKK